MPILMEEHFQIKDFHSDRCSICRTSVQYQKGITVEKTVSISPLSKKNYVTAMQRHFIVHCMNLLSTTQSIFDRKKNFRSTGHLYQSKCSWYS